MGSNSSSFELSSSMRSLILICLVLYPKLDNWPSSSDKNPSLATPTGRTIAKISSGPSGRLAGT